MLESLEADSMRSGGKENPEGLQRQAGLAPRVRVVRPLGLGTGVVAPPGEGSQAGRGGPGGARPPCLALPGSERTPTPGSRRRRRVPARGRGAPVPLPPTPARPWGAWPGAPFARPDVRLRDPRGSPAQSPGRDERGAGRRRSRATPAPRGAPHPAPGWPGSRRPVPAAASGGAGRPGGSRVRAARKLARSRRDLAAV